MAQLVIGELTAELNYKAIKNVHLSVYPPDGNVRVSVPRSMSEDTIRAFVISKLNWIKGQQQKLRNQEREAPREFINRESHYYNGERYLLKVVERNTRGMIELRHNSLVLHIKTGSTVEQRRRLLNEWYRKQLKASIPAIIEKYEKILNVKVAEFGVKRMKTKWGTCNPTAGRIWINLELAKKPPECLEYIVVHEMMHLLEPSHNKRFVLLMDRFMSKWQFYRDELNRLPVRHEDWAY